MLSSRTSYRQTHLSSLQFPPKAALSSPDTCNPSITLTPSSTDNLPSSHTHTYVRLCYRAKTTIHTTHQQPQPYCGTRRKEKRKSDRHPRRWQEIQTRSRPVTSGPHPAPKARADPRNTALAHFRTSDDTRPLPPSRPHLSVPSFPPLEILYSRSACCLFIDWTDLVACSFFQSNQRTKYRRFATSSFVCVSATPIIFFFLTAAVGRSHPSFRQVTNGLPANNYTPRRTKYRNPFASFLNHRANQAIVVLQDGLIRTT
ncbi:hypothetical protein BDP81DRAFT_193910 [Colletotrichum phormii]|uniref:Uncharacterized protein n=1 Tax=Colletotrichum phormii TaxID=359342 RepID=A0AAI9ZVK0_9PEZI|nr:uncharacterized protein BDP81DRAFT_193910 [Colletotrichum phormii]KAK1638953.1 hypothetical protein BDP81DRAFT_193910 [Colletotrichum phormii]